MEVTLALKLKEDNKLIRFYSSNGMEGVMFNAFSALGGEPVQVLCLHGNKEGTIIYHKERVNNFELLLELLKEGYRGDIYLISCYPSSRRFKQVTYGGLTLHNLFYDHVGKVGVQTHSLDMMFQGDFYSLRTFVTL